MFDFIIDFLAQMPGLGVVATLKEEGFRDSALVVLGALVAAILIRFGGSVRVKHWRRRSEDLSAKLQEAHEALHTQTKASLEVQSELTTTQATLSRMSVEVDALKRQREQEVPDGSLVVSVDTVERLKDGQLWSRPVVAAQADIVARTSKIPILAVGNLKGGVGKTTCVANLGAVYARNPGLRKRTLFIDFDFQSSLSGLLNAVSLAPNEDRVRILMDPTSPVDTRLVNAKPVSSEALVTGCHYYDCTMDVALLEDRLTLSWLLRDLEASVGPSPSPAVDLRFILKEFLLSDSVQSRYDLVLIDLPPRNSALAYNALCAATDLLIVTRPDLMSADSVERFIGYLEASRARLFPNLKIAGVTVNAVTGHDQGWRNRVAPIVEEALGRWQGRLGSSEILPTIANRVNIAQIADQDFAALRNASVRGEFELLAEALHLFDDDDVR